jgi:hypothetical protein
VISAGRVIAALASVAALLLPAPNAMAQEGGARSERIVGHVVAGFCTSSELSDDVGGGLGLQAGAGLRLTNVLAVEVAGGYRSLGSAEVSSFPLPGAFPHTTEHLSLIPIMAELKVSGPPSKHGSRSYYCAGVGVYVLRAIPGRAGDLRFVGTRPGFTLATGFVASPARITPRIEVRADLRLPEPESHLSGIDSVVRPQLLTFWTGSVGLQFR